MLQNLHEHFFSSLLKPENVVKGKEENCLLLEKSHEKQIFGAKWAAKEGKTKYLLDGLKTNIEALLCWL